MKPAAENDLLTIAGRTFRSRLLLGTGKFGKPEQLRRAVEQSQTEIVTVARKNYARYRDAVERMRYYASLGVEFKVCGLAAHDYDYAADDFYEFVDVVPSAITELAHWQLEGHALITPVVMEKRLSIEEIR